MREVKIIVNEDAEIVSVNDFFTFSVKYHNLSSTADTIPESERVVVGWSTTGIWLIDDDEFLIKEDGSWRNISKELSFFLFLIKIKKGKQYIASPFTCEFILIF